MYGPTEVRKVASAPCPRMASLHVSDGGTRRKSAALPTLRRLVVPDRRLRHQAAALARQGRAAVLLPVARDGALRELLPGIGPFAQRVAVPRRLHAERRQAELLPQGA